MTTHASKSLLGHALGYLLNQLNKITKTILSG